MHISWLTLVVCLWSSPASSFLAHDIFQTGDPRLFDLFCVASAEDLAAVALNTSTQQDIINMAVKRSVVRFLSERHSLPPPPSPGEMSLSQLYQHFLGPCSSPDRFVIAVNELVDSAAKLDILPGIKYDPRFHFDAESILDAQDMLVERLGLVVTSIMTEGKFPNARDLLGRSLHAIALFYSHSNWVELGHTSPLPGLGYPGGELPALASPSTPSCSGSNLTTAGLTSGYLPNQQEGADRCRHGSSQDPQGLGGINKDTGSPCWSQHYQHHQVASELATLAVEHYLDHLRFIIDDRDKFDNFGQLFDLSYGSALVIAIDQSGSMCEEIEAVKHKVVEIVNTALETGIIPSRYVLVPFDSPPVPDPIWTRDPEEYLQAVEALNCNGGGTEQFWTAVQKGLTNAPSYSDIIVFTDEPGDDNQLKESVIGLAESLSSQVSVVYSESTLVQDHLDLCTATGGLCILFNKVDASDIVDLLSSAMEEKKAMIAQYRNLTGSQVKVMLLDTLLVTEPDSLTEIQISGSMQKMVLQTPTGREVDLTDDASMSNSGLQMEVIIRMEQVLIFKFKPDEVGRWLLILDSSSFYSFTAEASCTFSFLTTFRYLDLATNHPNLHKLPGRPVRGSIPTLMTTLTGDFSKNVDTLSYISFVDPQGAVLESHPVLQAYTDQERLVVQTSYDSSQGLTNHTFYVRLEGKDKAGQEFHRLLPQQFTPASTQVEVTASSALLEITPCNQTYAQFLVSDFGEPTDVTIDVVDDKEFLVDFSPKVISLGHNASELVNATFFAPCSAAVGSVSTVTVTALSSLDQTSNSVSVSLTVVTGQSDLTPPVCRLAVQGGSPCQGTPPDLCATEDWLMEAQLQDVGSGLGRVRVNSEGGGNLTADFTPGTTEAVTVQYSTSCCNSNVSLTALDILGNWASDCTTQFTMNNCSLVLVTEVGPTWLAYEWSRPCGVQDSVEVDYTSVVTNLDTNDPGYIHDSETCNSWKCQDSDTYLTPCTGYQLDVTARYFDDSTTSTTAFTTTSTSTATTTTPTTPSDSMREVKYRVRFATTGEEAPSAPGDFSSSSQGQTSISLTWSSPTTHSSCLSHYTLCYRALPTRQEQCITTNTTTIVISGLEACTLYRVTLTSMTDGGLASPPQVLEAETLPDLPGPVEQLRVAAAGQDFITVEWDAPSVNPACVQGYGAFCYVKDSVLRTFLTSAASNSYTMTGLHACTDYTCEVESLGAGHSESSSSSVSAHTETSQLSAPQDFTADYTAATEALVSWSCPEQGCRCVHQFLLLWTGAADTEHGQMTVAADQLEAVLPGLLPCTRYTLTIQAVSHTETFGDAAFLELQTQEVAPGPVRYLSTTHVSQDGFEARWQDPSENAQCVASFQTGLLDADCPRMQGDSDLEATVHSAWHHYNGTNLTCDSCYTFSVSTVSPSGLQADPASVPIWTVEC